MAEAKMTENAAATRRAAVKHDATVGDAGHRAFQMEIAIDAPPEAVWRALTDAEELVRWFPLEARVTPGPGGSIWLSWGPPFEGTNRIEIWEPGRRLRMLDDSFTHREGAVPLAVDFQLEPAGGGTVLRLVHSGFGRGADWDQEYDSISRGWTFELRGLRHYLERHAGQERRVVWVRRRLGRQPLADWERLMGPTGLDVRPAASGLTEGSRYAFRGPDGRELTGEVRVAGVPGVFAGTVAELGDALMRVEIETPAGGYVWLWISTYGVPEEEVAALQRGFDLVLEELLPEAPPGAQAAAGGTADPEHPAGGAADPEHPAVDAGLRDVSGRDR